jgi:alpha-tubulin suppressor-like RCC1 family protein
VSLFVGVVLLAAFVQVAAPAAGRGEGRVAVVGQRLALGMAHTCLISGEGGVHCFGYHLRADTSVDLGPGRRAAALAAGDFHTCAILAAGTPDAGSVRCWGENRFGQLGYGRTDAVTAAEAAAAGPVDLGSGRTARALAAGSNFTCALLDDGDVRCWGGNSSGQLGLGNTTSVGDDETPATVPPVDLGAGGRAVAIAAGGFHACAVLDTGDLSCWGGNGTGELGHGDTAAVGAMDLPADHAPVRLGAGRTAAAVEAGLGTTCAILETGDVRCWGYGGQGALGQGYDESIGDDESPASVPAVRLGEGRRAVALALGAYHSCALLDDGTVRCWGPNGRGELGYGNTIPIGDAATPDQAGPVALDGRAVEIAAGGYHTCALLESGALSCWGPDDIGPLAESA